MPQKRRLLIIRINLLNSIRRSTLLTLVAIFLFVECSPTSCCELQGQQLASNRTRISNLIFELYEQIYRNYAVFMDEDSAQGIVNEIASLDTFIKVNCIDPTTCSDDIPGLEVDNVEYFIKKLLMELSHREEREALLQTVQSLSYACHVNVTLKAPSRQLHRAVNSRILGQRRLSQGKVARMYATYRDQVESARIPFDIHLGGLDEHPGDYIRPQPDLDRYHTEGERWKVIGGDPMLDEQSLSDIQVGDSEVDEDNPIAQLPLDPGLGTYRFTPVYDIRDGYLIAQLSQKIADDRLLFGCTGGDSHQADSAIDKTCRFLSSTRQKADFSFQISLCVVTGDVEVDPPFECQPFVLRFKNQTWIAVLDEDTGPGLGGSDAGPEELQVDFRVYFDKSSFAPLQAFAAVLQAEPFDLAVHVGSSAITATSPQRYSKILSTKYDPWHEWVSFRADQVMCSGERPPVGWEKLNSICIAFRANLLVNKQGNEDRGSWHLADSYLFERWRKEIRNSFLKSLHQECKREDVVGDRIACYASF